MATRGCGTRIAGGIYFVVPSCEPGAPTCRPHTDFWLDPPIPVDPDEFGIASLGVMAHPAIPGDVVDWVGGTAYPNVMDILSEVRQLGLSRRVQSTFDFANVTPDSSIWLVHSRGEIGDLKERTILWNHGVQDGAQCPKRIPEHLFLIPLDPTPMCAGLWKECVEGGQATGDNAGRTVTRKVGDTLYVARSKPAGLDLSYSPAFIARYPIHHIEVVKNLEDEAQQERAVRRAWQSGLDVAIVNE